MPIGRIAAVRMRSNLAPVGNRANAFPNFIGRTPWRGCQLSLPMRLRKSSGTDFAQRIVIN